MSYYDRKSSPTNQLNGSAEFSTNLPSRHRSGVFWRRVFQISTVVGIVFLAILLLTIANDTFGYVAITKKTDPTSFAINGVPLEELSKEDLVSILQENVSRGRFSTINKDAPVETLNQRQVYEIIIREVIKPKIEETWTLSESIFNKQEIFSNAAEEYPGSDVFFQTWLKWNFIISPQSSDPLYAGVRTAILGSLWIITIAIVVAFPMGIGAAIYLEEYAKGKETWINNLIQTNINNLAGVPSIIYGILGLAIFVRVLEPLTSGSIFGVIDPTTANGRTLLSAGLTMALLILPVIIINSQEAIKTVPGSLREASFGLGASRWQTVWYHVLPNALPGILTGTILAISRTIGETAPLVVIGASTYITYDPNNLFSKFTTLPIQIYQWTARPQDEFRNIAAAAIFVLLILLLTINSVAIILRHRLSRRLT